MVAKTKPPAIDCYRPKNHVRIVTAASLFDGHDAAINIMRRILQASGAEVIHLGHNRSVGEIVDCAIEEDAQGIAITSYQGGHVEFFKYMIDLLRERGAEIKVFGGGGGTILPVEIEELHSYGVARIYSPDDGRKMGLQGMINHLLVECDHSTATRLEEQGLESSAKIAQLITALEDRGDPSAELPKWIDDRATENHAPVLGVTGTGGAGKSSLVDELIRRFLANTAAERVAIISVDPSKRKTGGALLGDRIRMNSIDNARVYMRSLATRQSNLALSAALPGAIAVCRAAGYDLVVVETSGIGQSDSEIISHADVSLYVMTSDYGAATQLEKIDMLDYADAVAINKFDKRGSLDALRDVRKQFKRNHQQWNADDGELPIYGTIASQFGDPGVDSLYESLIQIIAEKTGVTLGSPQPSVVHGAARPHAIPAERSGYLAEIADDAVRYRSETEEQARLATSLYCIAGALDSIAADFGNPRAWFTGALSRSPADSQTVVDLKEQFNLLEGKLDVDVRHGLECWPEMIERYTADTYQYEVRDRLFEQPLYTETLSRTKVPRVAMPRLRDWGDVVRWLALENVPGSFPYTAGVFPLKRRGEDPARMFAGEGGPERTNRRFHYVSAGLPAARLSTAFDSVTLYGENPDRRPDIYGKVGNSGVSIATVDDAKKLYSGFDLSSPSTSVSMTINGPAPMLLAFYMNAAIDQGCEKYILENGLRDDVEAKISDRYAGRKMPRPAYSGDLPAGNDGLGLLLLGISGDEVLPAEVYERIKGDVLSVVRGTVQADILKEDQAQNTCIFSSEFALRMMGDIQRYFIDKSVRNFYSVSISGYHIAEAGANPITQLAFTLANGFTYVEYYLSRGMKIDEFAPNLSFFFSNGLDAEYSVIGRVARRIWARAMKRRYRADSRSQKLKYHIQTSGRSLHAQEIAFNDIRTTLQALYALYDNCNSLHTNAYDEAITTPTEESVRRAMAIQLIIGRELGLTSNENPLQGAFIIDEMTDLVEEAVLSEFERISQRGGVLGAMERMYQRTKIQEESLYYESRKHSGELPIIGVNTFLSADGSPTRIPGEVIRATDSEKEAAIASLDDFHSRNADRSAAMLESLQNVALAGENTFAALLEASKVCSLGQLSHALYQVGGQYRRNM